MKGATSTHNSGRKRGFSLVELTAVMALLAVLAASATLQYQSVLARSRMEDALGRLEQLDRQARAYASGHAESLVLGLDLSAGRLWCQDASGRDMPWGVDLPENLRLAQAVLASGPFSSGTASIPVSPQGISRSYAVCLEARNGRRQWIAIAGLTGQIWHPEAEPTFSVLREGADRP